MKAKRPKKYQSLKSIKQTLSSLRLGQEIRLNTIDGNYIGLFVRFDGIDLLFTTRHTKKVKSVRAYRIKYVKLYVSYEEQARRNVEFLRFAEKTFNKKIARPA